jgi:acetylornithine/succinyldiaminopimelate/putrescine aminotransferase
MGAWAASTGEAIHTQTFLGHPIGCAAALAVLERLAGGPLPPEGPVPAGAPIQRARHLGDAFAARISAAGLAVRGRGLMRAVETGPRPLSGLLACRKLLQRGWLVLPAGARADAVAFTPPACITDAQVAAFEVALIDVVAEVA